jgi:hypothetical protein
MIRNTLLALAATAGLVGTTELGTNQAQANTHISFGIYGGYRPRCYRPIVVGPVVVRPVVTTAVVYAPVTPVVVTTAVVPTFDVLVRPAPTAPWQLYANYATPQAAEAAVPALQTSGYWVMVQQH